MRISDWSSDVCSSDLQQAAHLLPVLVELAGLRLAGGHLGRSVALAEEVDGKGIVAELGQHLGTLFLVPGEAVPVVDDEDQPLGAAFGGRAVAFVVGGIDGDRTSVGVGKSVSVRVDRCGSRSIEKKNE